MVHFSLLVNQTRKYHLILTLKRVGRSMKVPQKGTQPPTMFALPPKSFEHTSTESTQTQTHSECIHSPEMIFAEFRAFFCFVSKF